MRDIIIAVGGGAGTAFVIAVVAVMLRVWRAPKRLDRLETVVPVLGRGLWALLALHVRERNGETPQDVKAAYDEITRTFTDGVVSQKAKP